ncbi:MAG: signal peptidase [Acidobacteriota bacterium]|jgi:signal peptidase II|nr:signal peptidase [Acidobacteriota bacterium]MDT7778545.1 signal peptidase [Acidobacteriota bacterium]
MIERGRGMRWRVAYLCAAFAVYMADQASKAWALRRLRLGDVVNVFDGFMRLAYAENPGIAFGRLQQGGEFSRWMLATLAALAVVGLLAYFFRTHRTDDRLLGALALLLAGVAGNLTDRVHLGHVIDFIEVFIGSYQWPTFNVADAAICTGAALLALDLILEGRAEGRRRKTGNGPEAVTGGS